MRTIASVAEMQAWSDDARASRLRIGFVPTMGYLHDGHLSLVGIARARSDKVVASIFVNPMQFGANEDLSAYPRDVERDRALLEGVGTDALFLPAVAEMYPAGYQTAVTVDEMTQGLCGRSRPTHFRGVTTVVAKLFNMVKPDVAVFGEKDFQQLAVLRRMTIDLNFPVEIVGGPIVRETDGLAMSSRNVYLADDERRAALCLSRALQVARDSVAGGERGAAKLRARVIEVIAAEPLARLDYADLVDAGDLSAIEFVERPALLALAAFVGRTRLIDNTVLK